MIFYSTRNYDGSLDYGHNNNPLAHLSESVNSIDPLNAMEKSINEVNIACTINIWHLNNGVEAFSLQRSCFHMFHK